MRELKLIQVANGGWVIYENPGDPALRWPMHAFTSSSDMLFALMRLIGVSEKVEEADTREKDWFSVFPSKAAEPVSRDDADILTEIAKLQEPAITAAFPCLDGFGYTLVKADGEAYWSATNPLDPNTTDAA